MSDTTHGNRLSAEEEAILRQVATRASGQAWGIAVGALCGLGLCVATVILVLRGGPNPGPHLGLLGAYFPGFEVTWTGSLPGLLYGALTGYLVGRTVAGLYNRLLT
jgi:hypothetical protein